MTVCGVRPAEAKDVPALVELMAEFYAEAGFPLPSAPATRAFETLIADPRLGRVWVLVADGVPVGHIVLTLVWSMEYGGVRGIVDDLFVRRDHRGRGLAALGLAAVRQACSELGVRALSVEVGPENDAARRLYGRAGLRDSDHLLLSMPLDKPLHEMSSSAPSDAG